MRDRSVLSRRDVLGLSAALLAAPAVSLGQDSKPADTAAFEKNLAKPLDETAKEKLRASIKYAESIRKQRMDFKLPENSEPCTRYIPSTVKGK